MFEVALHRALPGLVQPEHDGLQVARKVQQLRHRYIAQEFRVEQMPQLLLDFRADVLPCLYIAFLKQFANFGRRRKRLFHCLHQRLRVAGQLRFTCHARRVERSLAANHLKSRFHHRAGERGKHQLGPHRLLGMIFRLGKVMHKLERRHRRELDAAFQELHLLRQLQHEQPGEAAAVTVFGSLQLIENLDRHRGVAIDQRGEAVIANLVALEVDGFGQGLKIPARDVVALEAIAVQSGKHRARRIAKLHLQGREVARHGQLLAIGIDDTEVHQQMRRQTRNIPGIRCNVQPLHLAKKCRHRVDQRHLGGGQIVHAFASRDVADELAYRIGHRHDLAADFLRQRFEQRRHLVAQHAHGQPLEARGIHLVQHRDRERDGDAVHDVRGLETVCQRKYRAAMLERLGEQIERDLRRAPPHELFAGELQPAGGFLLRVAPPLLEAGHVHHVHRDSRIVEREHVVVVDQHVLAPRLGFDVFDIVDQLLVMPQKFSVRVDFAGDQPLANEDLARVDRIDGAVVHAPPRIDDQSIYRHLLERHHLPALALPMRLEMGARDKVRGQLFDPLGLNGSHGARIDARGLGQFRGHHPFHARRLLRGVLLVAARQLELDAAGAQVMVALGALGADVADETGEEGAVDVVVTDLRRFLLCGQFGGRGETVLRMGCHMHPGRCAQLVQLRMHVPPLTHAQRRDKIFMQHLVELAIRLLVLQGLLVKRPHIHKGEKLRLRMCKLLVRHGGILLLVVRPHPRVLHRQGGRNHQHLAHAGLAFGRQQHACDGGIHREFRQRPAKRGQPLVPVNRPQLKQLPVAVLDHARRGWFHKRKFLYFAQAERLHSQDHVRQ